MLYILRMHYFVHINLWLSRRGCCSLLFLHLPTMLGIPLSAWQVEKREPDLTLVFPKPFPLLSVYPHPHSLPRIPPGGYCHLSKNMTILKRKGSDVRSKVKGLSGIWESKPNESNFMFNNSQHNWAQTCGLINWFVFGPLYRAVSRRPTGWPYIMCAPASCCGSLLLTS